MNFRHNVIDPNPPCDQLGFCLTTDLTNNGRPDIIVGGAGKSFPARSWIMKARRNRIPTFRWFRKRFGYANTNLFWYENPGFQRHEVAVAPHLDVGATLCDVTRNGRPNVVAGQGLGHCDLYWFDVPDNPRKPWSKFLISNDFEKCHDLAAADIDNDGETEIVGISQRSETIFYFDIPSNPYESPWPSENLHIIDEGLNIEGIALTDIDKDGFTEIIAGTHIYNIDPKSMTEWNKTSITSGWDPVRTAVGDIDGDGDREIIFSEGDSPKFGNHPGRVALFDPPNWEPTFLKQDLYCPHSLEIADFSGNGEPDIYVAEMGLGTNQSPKHFLFKNEGGGQFEEHIIENGVPTHEATAVDLTGNCRPDIVGKSYSPDPHVDVWYNTGT